MQEKQVRLNMEIVITMAGIGLRFRKAGYQVPKYMIDACGKTLFEWSMESLKGFYQKDNTYYFVVRKEDVAAGFITEKCKQEQINNVRIIELDNQTDGQATSAMLAAKFWDKKKPLLIYNIDTYVEAFEMTAQQMQGDGFIPCFHAEGDHWSFVELAEPEKNVEETSAVMVREKLRISDNCTLGAYYFKSCELYERLYREYYSQDENLEKGEKYVAPLYNYLISQGGVVKISIVDEKKVHVLGTPEELQVFIDEYQN